MAGGSRMKAPFIVTFQAWGRLPLSAALSVIYSRNLHRWTREAIPLEDPC